MPGQGMLQQAAQSASQVPVPAQGGQDPAAAPPPENLGMPTDEKVPPGAPPGMGAPVDTMPTGPQAYQGEEVALDQTDADPREQEEYARVMKAMERVLYEEDHMSDSIMKQLDPNDKIGSATKATALLIQQLDEKIDMDEIVIPQVTMDAVDMVTELAENRYDMEYSEQEMQATLGSTWEAVMVMFGVNEKDLAELSQGMAGQEGPLRKSYDGFINQGVPAETPAAQPAGPPEGMDPSAAPVPMGA